ncbi:MAG TPA: 16S rRNA (uracil(1498)-N(3))-methyltransferase [Alphaproteobacteria bacterium]|jgi:16S rRNA (uracil1498-N3)-methyltransferase|nr:16S rRNA (uracil(1498)-N(3))-methyltransferase [Alphaproteobacteria bacterium]
MSSAGSPSGPDVGRGSGEADRDDETPSYRARARLFVDQALGPGAVVELGRDAAHYVRDVLRMRAGDSLAVFNGRDGEWRATLAHLARNAATVAIAERLRAPTSEPDVWLLFALLKRTRTDLVVEKATELGVARILPVMTSRTQASRVNLDRLAAIAREAAEQCERLTIPEVAEPRRLGDVLDAWPSDRRLIVADEAGGGRPIAEALANDTSTTGFPSVTSSAPPSRWALLIGPEGGFDGGELDRLRKLPFVTPVALGPRILRAETAALAALACVQALVGDWRVGVRRESVSS